MIEHNVELPGDAIAHVVFEVVGYFGADGDLMYGSRIAGEAPLSTSIGLVHMALADHIAENAA